MSARASPGRPAFTKDELYGSESQRSSRFDDESKGEAVTPPGSPMRPGEDEETNNGPLELEHVIGYTGRYPRTFLALPSAGGEMYVKAMGSILVIGDMTDPHAQKLLRAHDEPLAALAVARSGELVASGQVGATKRPGHAAPVVLWSVRCGVGGVATSLLFQLKGLTRGVRLLEFSSDDRFLAAAGDDNLLYIWDTSSGEVVFGKKFPKPLALLTWLGVEERGRRRAYRLAVGVEGLAEVEHCDLSFDATRQQWKMAGAPIQMPAAGMSRLYKCSALAGKYLLAGTSEGDLVVMKLASKVVSSKEAVTVGGVYRASVPVGSGGMTAVALREDQDETLVVFTGGGDGQVRRLVGSEMRWRIEASVQLQGCVTSLSFKASQSDELLVGTDAGRTYRLLADDLTQAGVVQVSVAHVGKPRALGFGRRADIFATAATDGELIVWDLADYQSLAVGEKRHAPSARRRDDSERKNVPTLPDYGGGARTLSWVGDVSVVVGYNDAGVRCYSASDGKLEWEIASAHRAPISASCAHSDGKLAYLVTAADDGSVRVWNLQTREVMMHFAEHSKSVSGLCVDVANPRLFHSAARDCAVFTHDLATERRTVSHVMRDGAFTGLSQRRDAENELVTCDANGRLLFWDCDYPEPVLGSSVDATQVQSVSVSPSGNFLALCRDEVLTIFALNSKGLKPIAQGWAHSDLARSAHWSPDEKQLVTIADDHCICIWNFFGSTD